MTICAKDWQWAFNPDYSNSQWRPINSSPNFRSALESHEELVFDALKKIPQNLDSLNFDRVCIFLSRGLELDVEMLEDIFSGLEVLVVKDSPNTGEDAKSGIVEACFDDWSTLDSLLKLPDIEKATLYIAPFTFDAALDIRPLLRAIKSIIRINANSRLVTATLKPTSLNPSWTAVNVDGDVFNNAMTSIGFKDLTNTLVNSYAASTQEAINFNFYRYTNEDYSNFFNSINVDPKTRVLNVTSESTHMSRTGGIGKYCEEFQRSDIKSYFLLTQSLSTSSDEAFEDFAWGCVDEFSATNISFSGIDYQGILNSCLQILFVLDEVTFIEYQDYLGLGFRVAQAKHAGLIPDSVRINCVAHGNQYYLNSGFDEFGKTEDQAIAVKERISAELADSTIFASNFLRKMYQNELGWRLKSTRLRPYPNSYSGHLGKEEGAKISKLVFLGKPTTFKGFNHFVEALHQLTEKSSFSELGIDEIIVIGAEELPKELENVTGVKVVCLYPSAAELSQQITNLAPSSLFLLPYPSDNAPLMVHEVISRANHYLFANSGGIPEIIPPVIAQSRLVDLNADNFFIQISNELSSSKLHKRSSEYEESDLVLQFYAEQNREFSKYFNELEEKRDLFVQSKQENDFSIVVTMYNPLLSEVLDCICGINNQYLLPKEVIFVDDASNDEAFDEAKLAIEMNLAARFRVIRLETNSGLSYARNVGLSAVTSKYMIALDIDDVIHPNYLYRLTQVFERNKSDIVTSGSKYFLENSNFRDVHNRDQGEYLPIGNSASLGLTGNTFGHACAGYRVEYLKSIGGWDASSRAMWEDWQLFLKASFAGAQISTMPEKMLFYRIREQSMLRTYKSFPAWLRITSELNFLPSEFRYEFMASIVANAMISNKTKQLTQELDAHVQQVNQLRAELLALGDKYYELKRSFLSRIIKKLKRLR
jgi:glycosyltransferase involved in cell wall biosynthesis